MVFPYWWTWKETVGGANWRFRRSQKKSSPNSCKQTRSSSAIGRQESGEIVNNEFVNETTHPDPVKSLLNVEKDSSSGSASLKSRSDFFSQSELWVVGGEVPDACWWAEQMAAVRKEILSSSTLGFRMPEKSDK
ncbi:hypothetical protein TNCV_194621 [Trichonephila clavipes]|nr:hypothetical protein TNCV_194621 [Trichonephila clavipes]